MRPSGLSLVLVDFDDTLVDTAPRFHDARERLFRRLVEAGLPEEAAREMHHGEVDLEMLREHGLGPARLEHSFPETYRRLCSRLAREIDHAVAEECAELGRGVAGTPPCLDGALDALRELAAAYPTVVYTQAADVDYQLRCVREAGVLEILPQERVRICERKTADEFHATIRGFGVADPGATCMIGNSIRADINPALLAGAHAIHVEVSHPWAFDVVEPVGNGFPRVPTFADAVRLLLDG